MVVFNPFDFPSIFSLISAICVVGSLGWNRSRPAGRSLTNPASALQLITSELYQSLRKRPDLAVTRALRCQFVDGDSLGVGMDRCALRFIRRVGLLRSRKAAGRLQGKADRL